MRKSFALLLMLAVSTPALSQPAPFPEISLSHASMHDGSPLSNRYKTTLKASADCYAADNKAVLEDAAALSGPALVEYFASRPSLCINMASGFSAQNSITRALWSDSNIAMLARAVVERSATYDVNNQQGVLSLMSALENAYSSQSTIYTSQTQASVIDALSRVATTTAFMNSSEGGAETAEAVFALAYEARLGDKIINPLLAYAERVISGGDAYKTRAHRLALDNMYDVLGILRAYNSVEWLNFIETQPHEKFDVLIKMPIYLSYINALDGDGIEEWLAIRAAMSFVELQAYPSMKAWVEDNTEVILSAYPKFSGPWMAVAQAYNVLDRNCARFNICHSNIDSSLLTHALPNTFSFDDGRLIFHTAVSRQKAQQLYHSLKQVEAQFKRVTQQSEPLADDPNSKLTLYVYDSRYNYLNYHQFLFPKVARWNGFAWGGYDESSGTVTTFSPNMTFNVSLEEYLRHDYVNYLIGRYTVHGAPGQSPSYDNDRLTWFLTGLSRFFTGSTQANGIRHSKKIIHGLVNSGEKRMTLRDIVAIQHLGGRNVEYATVLIYFFA